MSFPTCSSVFSGVFLSLACASKGLPIETPVTGESVVITVPEETPGAEGPPKGIVLRQIDRVADRKTSLGTYTHNPIRDFYSVSSTAPTPTTLITQVCRGEQHSDGRRDKSCISFVARVLVQKGPDGYRISITPVKVIKQQGSSAFGTTLDLPQFELADWYQYITDVSRSSQYRVDSARAPETTIEAQH